VKNFFLEKYVQNGLLVKSVSISLSTALI